MIKHKFIPCVTFRCAECFWYLIVVHWSRDGIAQSETREVCQNCKKEYVVVWGSSPDETRVELYYDSSPEIKPFTRQER